MSAFTTYFILQLNTIHDTLVGIMIITMLFIVICLLSIYVAIPESKKTKEDDDRDHLVFSDKFIEFCKKYFKLAISVFIMIIILRFVLPTTNQAFAIYVIPKITSNEVVKNLPEKLSKLLDVAIANKQ